MFERKSDLEKDLFFEVYLSMFLHGTVVALCVNSNNGNEFEIGAQVHHHLAKKPNWCSQTKPNSSNGALFVV